MAFLNPTQEISQWRRIYGNYVVSDSGCWDWIGNNKRGPYGHSYLSLNIKGTKPMVLGVYRALYALVYDMPAKGLHLDHLCRNTNCVNPTHLEPVTTQENQRRSPISITNVNGTKTHCKRGHEFTESNTYTPPKRQNCRYCLTCKKQADAKRYA